jgi:hypothetical protein
MPEITDFTDSGTWILETTPQEATLQERHGQSVPYDPGDAEIRLAASDRELTACPVAFPQKDGCHFALFEGGDRRYRCQSVHSHYRQCGTDVDECDDLIECVVSLLQAQADHLAQERGDANQRR